MSDLEQIQPTLDKLVNQPCVVHTDGLVEFQGSRLVTNFPRSFQELLSWPYHGDIIIDRWGQFCRLTGFEGEGVCYWCGGELTGKATRWCRKDYGTDNAHWRLYHRHFDYNDASYWCFLRYAEKCANCGKREGLETHHIIPLNGQRYQYSLYHLPWNLICLCHQCHVEVHAAMRALKALPDSWDNAQRIGQMIMRFEI